MHFSPSFVTTVASLSAASRLALGLHVRSVSASKALRSSRSSSSRIDGDGGNKSCVVSAALAFLEGKKAIVECLSPADYATVDATIGASVGGHMRHSLDHFSKCLSVRPASEADAAAETDSSTSSSSSTGGTIRYDHRVRGGSVETDPAEATKVIDSLLEQLRALPRGHAGSLALRETSVAPAFMLGPGGGGGEREEHTFESNLERELFFCCHHGTHHDAMIQLILGRMGGHGAAALSKAGDGFGVAPSTAEFRGREEGGGK